MPFDKITDCDIEEPAGATCCCIENVLSKVNIDTASSGGQTDAGPQHEIVSGQAARRCIFGRPAASRRLPRSRRDDELASCGTHISPSGPQVLIGLKDAHNFKRTVWDMKRSGGATFAARGAVGKGDAMERAAGGLGGLGGDGDDDDGAGIPLLLREIRDELRVHTAILKAKA